MAEPNTARGELKITFNGREYTVTPTYRSLSILEERLGSGVLDLWSEVQKMSITATTTIIWCALTNGGEKNKPTLDTVGEIVMQQGVSTMAVEAGRYLAVAIRGLYNTSEDDEDDEDDGGTPVDPKSED